MKGLSNDQLRSQAPAVFADAPFPEVSDKYVFIPTIQVVDMLRDAGFYPVEARQAGIRTEHRDGFQKHMVRFSSQAMDVTPQERLDLTLINSHDRGSAFQLMASVFRKVCANGLMVSSELFNFSHKHLGFDGDAFLDSAREIAGGAGEIAAEIDTMKTIELTPDERGVFARAAHTVRFEDPERAPIRPERLLEERRYDDEGKDLWTTYNVIQENVMKGGLHGEQRTRNGKRRRVKTRPIRGIDQDVKLNKALWTMAEEMRRLKTES
jgi:hypothetical protein